LIEGKRQVVAILHVATREHEPYSDRHLEVLSNLGARTLPAINRSILRSRLDEVGAALDIVGSSPALLTLEREIKRAATHDKGPVLITGERGSGKEVAAWAIHCWSRRRKQPFVPVLASAFAEDLVADELFGHERHAFTGAARHRAGRFGAANGGSLFLDEVGDLPLPIQATLMRVIDYGEISRVGRDQPIKVDVRVIAATNRDLATAMDEGAFRRDLYDRLHVFELEVPPLRSRPEDIAPLFSFFLQRQCEITNRQIMLSGEGLCERCRACIPGCVRPEVFDALTAYHWPGNIRELANLAERLAVMLPDDVLDVHHLPGAIRSAYQRRATGTASRDEVAAAASSLRLDAFIRQHIERVLALTGQNQTRAAKLLGLPLSTLRNKMKKLGVRVERA